MELVSSDREVLKLVDFNQHLVVKMDSLELREKNSMRFFGHSNLVVHNWDMFLRETHVFLLPFRVQNLLVIHYSNRRRLIT